MSKNPHTKPQAKPASRAELELIVHKVRELIRKSPEKAATILTDWVNKPRSIDKARETPVHIKKKAG